MQTASNFINNPFFKNKSDDSFFNYNISVKDICIFIIFFSMVVVMHSLNSQIAELHSLIEILSQHIVKLENELIEKDLQITALSQTVESFHNIAATMQEISSETLKAKNDRTKFLIITLGVCIGSVVLIGGIYYGFNCSSFLSELKSWVPDSILSVVQNHFPLSNKVDQYFINDSVNNFVWKVEIINNKTANIFVKFFEDTTFQTASKFFEPCSFNPGIILPGPAIPDPPLFSAVDVSPPAFFSAAEAVVSSPLFAMLNL